MKAQLMGFIWKLGKGISLQDFFDHLNSLQGVPVKFGFYDRLLYTGVRGNYYVGLLLTIKDQRRITEIQEAGGEYKISVRSLEDRSNLVDFNFFLVNRATSRGLYQHYHNSCSLNQFCKFCLAQYMNLKESCKEQELKVLVEAGDADPDDPQVQGRIDDKYNGDLAWEVMVRPERLSQLLDEFKRIGFFEFELSTLAATDGLFAPLNEYVEVEKHRLRFTRKASVTAVKDAIVSVVTTGRLTKGRIGGRGTDNLEKVIRLLENPDSFGKYEYDDLADETVLNLADVSQSRFVSEMLTRIDEHKALFEAPVKP